MKGMAPKFVSTWRPATLAAALISMLYLSWNSLSWNSQLGDLRASKIAMPRAVGSQLAAAPVVRTAPEPSGSTGEKLRILQEILRTRQDDDPRLDRELRHLNGQEKREFRGLYETLPAEKLGSRGLILFLLGRNLEGQEDYLFFESVFAESPCLSLADCRGASAQSGDEPVSHAGGQNALLTYPQRVALKMLERRDSKGLDAERRVWRRRALEAATAFGDPEVARLARGTLQGQGEAQ